MNQFCVYVHKRPDGSPFYVGKGLLRRAYDFAPSRRTPHHKNIVAKYGRDNIQVDVLNCQSEEEAFDLETKAIACFKRLGISLVNLTSGGEGAAGRAVTRRQLEGLAKGRGTDHFDNMPEISKRNIEEGLARGRAKYLESLKTPEGKARKSALSKKARQVPRRKVDLICVQCGHKFQGEKRTTRTCSKRCEQQNRRARQKAASGVIHGSP